MFFFFPSFIVNSRREINNFILSVKKTLFHLAVVRDPKIAFELCGVRIGEQLGSWCTIYRLHDKNI